MIYTMQFKMQFRKFIIALIKKMVERSPLKYKATRAISCISPSLILYNRMTSEARMTDVLQILHDLGRITSTEADDAKAKFSELYASAKNRSTLSTGSRTLMSSIPRSLLVMRSRYHSVA